MFLKALETSLNKSFVIIFLLYLIENLKFIIKKLTFLLCFFTSIVFSQNLEFTVIVKDFDTDLHEAITKIPAPSKKLKGKVVDVVQKAYTLNDKVIRFAKVVIGE